MTKFQEFVVRIVERSPNRMAGIDYVASRWPGWKKRSAHGALVGHVRRVSETLPCLGRVPGRDRFDPGTVFLRSAEALK